MVTDLAQVRSYIQNNDHVNRKLRGYLLMREDNEVLESY